jgi:sterol desaturase/sphingolipid hydroxylase (fatty acid hydroxylase superfamily)
MESILEHASEIYAYDYFGIVLIVALIELAVPRRPAGDLLRVRWVGNIGIAIFNIVLVRLIFPMLGVAWAAYCVQRGWGLFNLLTPPIWLAVPITVIVLDAAGYVQHVLFHRIPWLWRIHRTHHTDQEFDLTTGVRFHPVEAVITVTTTLVLIAVLGAPPIGVLFSQIVTVASAFFEHANIRVPRKWDRVLRVFVVTPDVHRTHHSMDGRESQSNFGVVFPWWDRLLGTYIDQPRVVHERLALGVAGFGERKHLTLPWMLAQPFLREQRPQDAAPAVSSLPRVP